MYIDIKLKVFVTYKDLHYFFRIFNQIDLNFDRNKVFEMS